MAIEIATLSSNRIVVAGREALDAIGRLERAERPTPSPGGLASELTADGGGRRGVTLSVADAAALLAKSLAAGQGIVGALTTLQGSLRVAATQGALVSPLAGVVVDERTRVSGVNIQAAAGRVVGAIGDLVKATAFGGANLIASGGPAVTIQTGEFGGSIRVSPQPLDAAGLGIAGLAAISAVDARDASARVAAAVVVARDRLGNLQLLEQALGFATRGGQSVGALLDRTAASLLPRGSLVNFVA
jgi:hypothetical protein